MSNNTTNVIAGFFIILVALPLFILWLRDFFRRARVLRYSKAQAAGRASAYILGVCFVILGVINFSSDLEQGQSTHSISSCVFDVVFVIFGSLTWLATRFRYGGGFWSIVGGFLVGGAMATTVTIIDTHIRGLHYDAPLPLYIRTVCFWLVGSALFLIGHRRHLIKKKVQPNTALEATADKGSDSPHSSGHAESQAGGASAFDR